MISIAIHQDRIVQPGGQKQSFSACWIELASLAGVRPVPVNVYAHDAIARIRECDGLMWRYGYDAVSRRFAKMFLPAIEHGLGFPVFPNWKTSWTFEDKLAQRYLLEAAGIPMPETHVLWQKEEAAEFVKSTRYPFVLKLSSGIRSGNVVLVNDFAEAKAWIELIFTVGINSLDPLKVGKKKAPGHHKGYFYAQQFLPDNGFDTRVTVIGNRAFAFRRFNRVNDFRASGSGNIDWSPGEIDLETVRLGFHVAKTLGLQSVAIDGMRHGQKRLVGEVSYTYAAWAIEACPGHWCLQGDASSGPLQWVAGSLRAEAAIFQDFLEQVRRHQAHKDKRPLQADCSVASNLALCM